MNTTPSTTETNGIVKKVSHGPVTIDKLYKSDYQKKGTQSVQLRQLVTTDATYPSVQPKTGGLFSTEEFGIEGQEFTSTEQRIAWVDVPEDVDAAAVQARLDAMPEKGIMKVLSNRPILSANQKNAVERGVTELDTFANSQVVRYPDGHEKEGQLILDKSGKIQYRVNSFEPTLVKDTHDMRTPEPEDYYASEALAEELENTVGGSVGVSSSQII